jgi:hypothetical protein
MHCSVRHWLPVGRNDVATIVICEKHRNTVSSDLPISAAAQPPFATIAKGNCGHTGTQNAGPIADIPV